jgi:hypothetical protein
MATVRVSTLTYGLNIIGGPTRSFVLPADSRDRFGFRFAPCRWDFRVAPFGDSNPAGHSWWIAREIFSAPLVVTCFAVGRRVGAE